MATRHPAETLPARRASSGTLPEPLLSSKPREWNGIVVEVYRVREVDVVAQYSKHIVFDNDKKP